MSQTNCSIQVQNLSVWSHFLFVIYLLTTIIFCSYSNNNINTIMFVLLVPFVHANKRTAGITGGHTGTPLMSPNQQRQALMT